MNIKIKSIKLINFRSFEDEEIFIDDVTVVVGPNNAGKSNILRAIELLSPNVPLDINRDKRRNSSGTGPELLYKLEFVIPYKHPKLDFKFPDDIIEIKKTDKEWILQNPSPESLYVGKDYYRNDTGSEILIQEEVLPSGGIIAEANLSEEIKLQLTPMSADEVNNALKSAIDETIKGLLPIVMNVWTPKDEDFIAEDNPIDQIISNLELPLSKLLLKSFEKKPSDGDFREILSNGTSAEIETYCNNVTETVNEIFKENWNFKPKIKLKISPREGLLKVYFNHGRAGNIEPAFSSDGVNWLVSFFVRLGIGERANSVILLDQPGDKLFPGGQKDLVRILETLGKNNQIIYSTHSPFMISKNRLGRNVRIITKESDEKGDQISCSRINNEIKQTDIRQSDLLTTALGFYWTDFIPVGEFNVLMEGKLDNVVVMSTEKQKVILSGVPEIDFSRVAVRGVGRASLIDERAKGIKQDGRKVLGVFDGDWKSVNTPNLEASEKIYLDDIDSTWSDIEDVISTEYIKNIFDKLKNEFGLTFQYRQTMDGPGRGKKIKKYLEKKAKEKKINSLDLINKFEIKMIEYIEEITETGMKLPESFDKLNKEIIKHIIF
ncbi:MAG: AAA family ATPase [Candidatus Daviesbacteria bacterium]|nr:AAA family ATPase [Candidatus Daviesbacteria bacterium]